MSMTPKERWLAVLAGQKPDRIPMDYWATAEATEKLKTHLGIGDERKMLERLNIDRPFSVSPRYVGPAPEEGCDIWGCRSKLVDYGSGTYSETIYSPLAHFNSVEAIQDQYSWPQPDAWDYSDLPAQVRGWEDYPIRGGGSEPFLLYKRLRGQEQAFMDLIEYPHIVDYCLDKLFDLARENSTRIYEALPGQVNISYVAEDLGSQESLMCSLEHIRRFLLPRMKRMIDLAHEAGAYVFFHSDGAIRDVLPDMIDLGIDVLNPIQWRCPGMEREGLKADFGERLIFHGGVDNQQTLPFGTPDHVRAEVADNLRILGANGGYILAPCHNIQSVSPPENVVALYEAGFQG
ncbi:MAG: uroporphyrinogen-III decarboxylase-like protein [Gemmatimonadetes bacterium]|jgi:uroporphyrinogen decarboxylase|nr:uroporphyrinogen-III decarboxylase-like protein [Gemmatimonadota bacterium]HCV23763.1 uroporphyrinogen-III decarboxylase-like protein [Candidatus Latescibacterota bacterium]|tara:strand:+ start:245 stop:1285 length:1041 start_codon:yes stop_codon:yes gene_type:complete